MDKRIYLDYAATTPIRKEVLDNMLPFLSENFGNPSSFYTEANIAKEAMEKARGQVAKTLNADSNEIYFTSSGSESDNWAVRIAVEGSKKQKKHIITSKIEHPAIMSTMKYWEQNGVEITYLEVDEFGFISLEELEKAIKDETILITIMYANNEVGTIMPIKEIAKIAKEHKILFHTDAVQAFGSEKIDVKEMGIDMLSLSGHKIYAPKGIGALYIRKGIIISPLIHGGGQERSKRAGTENVAAIVGLGKASELAASESEKERTRLIKLRDKLIKGLEDSISDIKLNGDRVKRLANNVNISFQYVEGESILMLLNMAGIAASSGSACASGSLDPSHVLMGIGLTHEIAHGSIRFTLGKYTSEEDIDYLIEKMPGIIEKLRQMSPLLK